jgi:hypothetical protein
MRIFFDYSKKCINIVITNLLKMLQIPDNVVLLIHHVFILNIFDTKSIRRNSRFSTKYLFPDQSDFF